MHAARMSLLTESRQTLRLACPLIIGQLSQMLMGVVDTVMLGHLGEEVLAALALANALFYILFVGGVGLLTSVSVFSSNARGAGDATLARQHCRCGLWMALWIGLLLLLIAVIISQHLHWLHQPAAVLTLTPQYFLIICASAIPGLMALALKYHADALNRPWPPFWIFLGGVALNVGLNALWIDGNWGMPRMGMNGAAWATFVARCATLLCMWLWLKKARCIQDWVPRRWLILPSLREMRRHLAVSIPASLQMLCEVTAFSVTGLMMGYFGVTAMAAHQVAMTCAAMAFMVPLGLSMALTMRMSEHIGANREDLLRPLVLTGWWMSAGFTALSAVIFLCLGRPLAQAFTRDASVIEMTVNILVVAGVFQLVDGWQVSSAALLRGMHDTRYAAVTGFVAYWLIGLPVAWLLGMHLSHGPPGVWWGLALGLLIASLVLAHRLWHMLATRFHASP